MAKVQHIAGKLDIPPEWLMAVMWFESKIDPRAQNPYTNATGLIQFYPGTAIGMGTTINRLLHMTNVEQLDWVYDYLKVYKSKLDSVESVYLAVFYPRAMDKPDWYKIGGEILGPDGFLQRLGPDGFLWRLGPAGFLWR